MRTPSHEPRPTTRCAVGAIALGLGLMLASCSSDGLTGNGGHEVASDGGAPTDGAAAAIDLTMIPPIDLAVGTTMVGGACNSACDCTPGLACYQGKCTQAPVAVYCCESSDCPSGSVCEPVAGGGIQRCGGGGFGGRDGGGFGGRDGGGFGGRDGGRPMRDGGFNVPDGGPTIGDGGTPAFCGNIPCQTDSGCQALHCGSCDMTTHRCQ